MEGSFGCVTTQMDPNHSSTSSDRNPRAPCEIMEPRWYFTRDQLLRTPSFQAGIGSRKEQDYRIQCAELIQNIGERLALRQLAINTAVLFMHRFYQFHPLTKFHQTKMAPAFIFLAAKAEEQPRQLDNVIKATHRLLNPTEPSVGPESQKYVEQQQSIVLMENVLLQTLGFDLTVEHPHAIVIPVSQKLGVQPEMSRAAYELATSALLYTNLCVKYSPNVVAAMCMNGASLWSKTKIPLSGLSRDNKPWHYYLDQTLTTDLIQQVTREFYDLVQASSQSVQRKVWSHVLSPGSPRSQPAVSKDASGIVDNKPVSIPAPPTVDRPREPMAILSAPVPASSIPVPTLSSQSVSSVASQDLVKVPKQEHSSQQRRGSISPNPPANAAQSSRQLVSQSSTQRPVGLAALKAVATAIHARQSGSHVDRRDGASGGQSTVRPALNHDASLSLASVTANGAIFNEFRKRIMSGDEEEVKIVPAMKKEPVKEDNEIARRPMAVVKEIVGKDGDIQKKPVGLCYENCASPSVKTGNPIKRPKLEPKFECLRKTTPIRVAVSATLQ